MVTIKTYFDVTEAGFGQSLLESMGIHSFLQSEYSFSIDPTAAVGGIRLQVDEPDVDQAKRILIDHEGAVPLPDDFVPPPGEISEDSRGNYR